MIRANRDWQLCQKPSKKCPARAVVIFAYDGAQLIDIAGPTQTLTTANEEGASPPYAIRLAAVSGGPIRTASGVKLIADPLPRAVTIDTLLVPGGPGIHMFRKDRRALAALQRLCMRSRRICAVCTGAIALAEIGLLNKCRVVTHWRSCAQLAEEFPEVCVDPEPLFIQVGKIWTTAGVTAGIDLSLALIEQDHSAALSVARRLVVYMKRPGGQRQYSEPLELQRATSAPYDSLMQKVASRPAAAWRIETLAASAGQTTRTFHRKFVAATGVTPAEAVQKVRCELARSLLQTTRLKLAQIADKTGFGSESRLRRSLKRQFGVGARDLRERF
jgi:transcriptional regulator GlxA family with amidase domain